LKIAICLPGLEDVAEKEVKGKKIAPGRVEFDLPSNDFKSISTIYSLIKHFDFKNLDDLESELKNITFKIDESFKVICNRKGNHNFNSTDVNKIISISLIKKGYKLDFKSPKTIIYLDIIDSRCFVGYLEKENLSKRAYRIRLSNQTLNPCLAYSLISMSGFKKNDVLLDPFCRDGIIAIEAALLNKGKVIALDYSSNNIKNSTINAKTAKAEIEFINDSILNFNEKVDIIIAYPPFYSKKKDKSTVINQWQQFLSHSKTILKKSMVLICPKEDIKDYLQDYKILEERKIVIGNTNYFIFHIQEC